MMVVRCICITLFTMIAFMHSVEACTCFPLEVTNYLKGNDTLPRNQQRVIIRGIVLSSDVGYGVFHKYGKANAVNVKILEYWPSDGLKYVESDTITVFNDESDCEVNFKQDSVYLIRAYTFNRYLGTSICEGTKLLSKSEDDLIKLGEGRKLDITNEGDENTTVKVDEPEQESSYLLTVLVISLIINILLIYFLLKKRKNPPLTGARSEAIRET